MNEAGVLGRFVPEFGHAVGLMQFNMYHHYTVDEHLIRAVGNVASIERGEHKEDNPLATDIIKRIYHLGDQQAYRLREAMKVVYEDGASETHDWETGKAYWLPASEGMKRHADVNTGSKPIEVMVVEVRKAD